MSYDWYPATHIHLSCSLSIICAESFVCILSQLFIDVAKHKADIWFEILAVVEIMLCFPYQL